MKKYWAVKKESRQAMAELKDCHYTSYVELRALLKRLRESGLNMYELEIVRRDVAGMVREGAQRGESVAQTLGGDAKGFVKELFAACQKRSWPEQISYLLEHFCGGALIGYLVYCILFGRNGSFAAFTPALAVNMCYVGMVQLLNRLLYSTPQLKKVIAVPVSFLLVILLAVGYVFLIRYAQIAWSGIVLLPMAWGMPGLVALIMLGGFHLLRQWFAVKAAERASR